MPFWDIIWDFSDPNGSLCEHNGLMFQVSNFLLEGCISLGGYKFLGSFSDPNGSLCELNGVSFMY